MKRTFRSALLLSVTSLPCVLLAADRIRWELFVIPILWCAITGATLWIMKSPEALLMPLVGVLALILAANKSLQRGHGDELR